MNEVLTVQHLGKRYPGFALQDVSFELEPGRITGFIGRNGAGKTTTLKSMLHFVHPDSGEVRFFGQRIEDDERGIKERIGFVSGGVDYYTHKKCRAITGVTRRFFPQWDDGVYAGLIRQFGLDDGKTPAELSAGMRVKYALALALSHKARLLLLDEPTSGLDPVSREDLLELFLSLRAQGITILFSTHITSDLDQCADNILYIRGGRILAQLPLDRFRAGYRVVERTGEPPAPEENARLIGCRRSRDGYSALVTAADAQGLGEPTRAADLNDIMIHLEKEGTEHE